MTGSNANTVGNTRKAGLPRRDWIILPMLSLLTIAFVAVSTELVARRMFPGRAGGLGSCLVTNDPSTGVRGIPNTVCRQKVPEGQEVEFRFNGCGDYAGMGCELKPAESYRIVMVGTSFAMGSRVPREQSFAALLPGELSRQTGRRVELYNEALLWEYPRVVDLRFNKVLAAGPDMILWILTAVDVKDASLVLPEPDQAPTPSRQGVQSDREAGNSFSKSLYLATHVFTTRSFPDAISYFWKRTGSRLMLQHYLYKMEGQSRYAEDSLKGFEGQYLQAKPSAEWKGHLDQLDRSAADIEARAKAAGVPLVAVFLPTHGQLAIVSSGKWPVGFDPYRFDDELRAIIVRHGGIYIDTLPDLSTLPNPGDYYFPADGHPNAQGNAAIATFLAKELTSGAAPAITITANLKAALQAQPAQEAQQ